MVITLGFWGFGVLPIGVTPVADSCQTVVDMDSLNIIQNSDARVQANEKVLEMANKESDLWKKANTWKEQNTKLYELARKRGHKFNEAKNDLFNQGLSKSNKLDKKKNYDLYGSSSRSGLSNSNFHYNSSKVKFNSGRSSYKSKRRNQSASRSRFSRSRSNSSRTLTFSAEKQQKLKSIEAKYGKDSEEYRNAYLNNSDFDFQRGINSQNGAQRYPSSLQERSLGTKSKLMFEIETDQDASLFKIISKRYLKSLDKLQD